MSNKNDSTGCSLTESLPLENDWQQSSLVELIDHIIGTYHLSLREKLLRISKLADEVVTAHGRRHSKLSELLDVFRALREGLELHTRKEEMILFPAIKSMETGEGPGVLGCGGGIERPIQVMLFEHDEAGAALAQLRRLTNEFVAPPDACIKFKALYAALQELELETQQHVHKENNILFPRALKMTLEAADPCSASCCSFCEG
jgi:regulator of cell morphogenesis and NO signaling